VRPGLDFIHLSASPGQIQNAARRTTGTSLALVCLSFKERCARTSELTRRREFIQASPDELRCETRSRRSRPTICYVSPFLRARRSMTRLPAIEFANRSRRACNVHSARTMSGSDGAFASPGKNQITLAFAKEWGLRVDAID